MLYRCFTPHMFKHGWIWYRYDTPSWLDLDHPKLQCPRDRYLLKTSWRKYNAQGKDILTRTSSLEIVKVYILSDITAIIHNLKKGISPFGLANHTSLEYRFNLILLILRHKWLLKKLSRTC